MKHFIVLVLMLSAPAYATNVMYSPMSDPITNAPSILYFTDQHSPSCKGKWYVASMSDSETGKELRTNPTCWTFNTRYGLDIWVPSAGILQRGIGRYAPVPGTHDIYSKLMQENMLRMKAEFQNELRAYQQADPQP